MIFSPLNRQIFLPLLFLILAALLSIVKAQDKPAGGVWSLEQCIKYAIKNNVTVMQNDLQTESALSNYQQSKISRLPSVNANASQALNWGRSINPFTNDFVNQRINSNNFSLSASMNIFNGFQTQNQIKQNAFTYEVNQLNAQQTRNTTALNVSIAYLNILLNKELLVVAEKNVASTKDQLERTEKLFKAGAIAENDVINLRATLANNELAVVNALNQVTIAKATIQQLMNHPMDNSFEVENVPIESLNVVNFDTTPEQIYKVAEGTQVNVKSADINIKSREYAILQARSGRYPSLTLNGVLFSGYSSASSLQDTSVTFRNVTVGYLNGDINQPVTNIIPSINYSPREYTFFPQLKDNFRQQISLNLSIPIFNGWQVRNQVSQAIINKKNAEYQAQSVRNQLRIDIENAFVNAKSALNTYEARVKQLEAQELAFLTAEKRYNAGAANVVDFNIARINRDNARSDLVRAKYDYLFRKKVLDFYENKPLFTE